MTLYVLPTTEGKIPPLLEKEPVGGRKLYESYVQMLVADQGARLPEDYFERSDYWILQYLNGHFYDVTDYYRGRKRDSARRVIRDIETVRASVNREEYYTNYERFSTPNGGPVFFSTPDKEIFTQIGGSTAILPPQLIPPRSSLRFDISWMYDSGDGGWAQLQVRAAGKESTLYREYMEPNSRGKGLRWKEVRLDLRPFENQEVEIILKCYNDPGKNTISDWLNWRDIVLEIPK